MAEDKKNPKEASNIFHSIMKASVKVDKPTTELDRLLKDEKLLLKEIEDHKAELTQLQSDLEITQHKIKKLRG